MNTKHKNLPDSNQIIVRRPKSLYSLMVAGYYMIYYIIKFCISPFTKVKGNPVIIIPVRDREEHLKEILKHLNQPILIVEQSKKHKFNRGSLFNAGVRYLEKENYTHYYLHDVDMIPKGFSYHCFKYPTVVAMLLSRNNYRTYPYLFYGGVSCIPKKDFKKINGFSNSYYGWGLEDDDFVKRLRNNTVPLNYFPGIFKELPHECNAIKKQYEKNKKIFENIKDNTKKEGLNNIQYKIIKKTEFQTINKQKATRILVEL